MHFKSFYAANRPIITPRFRAHSIGKDLAMIDIKRAWKRLKKIHGNQISKTLNAKVFG